MDEMVGLLTQEKFKSKIVVILAGYDQDMNKLMSVNAGLSSRFPEEIVLKNFPPAQCLELLDRELKKMKVRVYELEDQTSVEYQEMVEIIESLSSLPSWGNARDINTVSKQMISRAIMTSQDSPSGAEMTLTGQDAVACMENMLMEKRERCANIPSSSRSNHDQGIQQILDPPSAPPSAIRTAQATKTSVPKAKQKIEKAKPKGGTPLPRPLDGRDDGVTDEIWHQLQVDKKNAEDLAKQSESALRATKLAAQQAANREKAQQALLKELAKAQARDAAERAEIQRKREEAQRKELAARLERIRLKAKQEEEEKKKREEVRVQQKLRTMGVCCAGFQWIKQSSGYRCAGGSHFVGNGSLGI